MKVDHHISELLYDHDCVIVPSFGGFLSSYGHAMIHPSQHTFSPPSKKIAFNIFLKQNDGLLANHIAGHEKVSYAEALSLVERYVNTWRSELSEGKKLVIDRIGTFYLYAEKNIQFDPVKNINYLRDAFGLGPVQSLPVMRETNQQRAEKQVREMMTLRPSAEHPKQPFKLSGKSRQKLLSTLIISATLLWFSLNLYLITPHRLNLSSLNPFSATEKTAVPKQPVVKEKNSTPAVVETVFVASAAPATVNNEVKPEPITETKPPVPATETTSPIEQQHYFVIGGAFQVSENADAFVKTLQSEGFSGARILDAPTRLKMVCFNGFSSREEAKKESDSLNALNRSTWIYKW